MTDSELADILQTISDRGCTKYGRGWMEDVQAIAAAADRLREVAGMRAALRGLYDAYCVQMHEEFDYHDDDWSPEGRDDKAALAKGEPR